MHEIEAAVRELLAAAQAERKAKLDAGWVDTVFVVGDRVLLRTKELLDAADIGGDGVPESKRLHPRTTSQDALQSDRHRRSAQAVFERATCLPAPGPTSEAGQEGEHEVELLLNRRTVRGVTRYLVRWRGHESADDEWLRLEELAHCLEKVAEYDAAAPRRRHAKQRDAAAPAAAPPQAWRHLRRWLGSASRIRLSTAPVGFRHADSAGRTVLFRWPTEGWVRGTAVRRSRAAADREVFARSPVWSVVGIGRCCCCLAPR
jgi:hypothetical protein